MKNTLAIAGIFALWFIIQWLTEVLAPYATPIGIGIFIVVAIVILKAVSAVLK